MIQIITGVIGYMIGLGSGIALGGLADIFENRQRGKQQGRVEGYLRCQKDIYQNLEKLAKEHKLKITGVDNKGRTLDYTIKDILDRAIPITKE